MHILIVGAGSVGLAYGAALSAAGAKVSYLIKPHHRTFLLSGLRWHRLSGTKTSPEGESLALTPEVLLDNPLELEGKSFDYALVTLPSHALEPIFLDSLATYLSAQTHVVSLSPGVKDQKRLRASFPQHPLSNGFITLIAFNTPLPKNELAPGVAVWQPPFSSLPFHGDKEALSPFIKKLNEGGLRSMHGGLKAPEGALASAILMPLVSALAGVNYAFKDLKASPLLPLAKAASREALAILATHQQRSAPLPLKLVTRLPWNWLLRVGEWAVPFSLETYLKVHFEKVRPQTVAALAELRELAQSQGKPHQALDSLALQVFG